MPTRAVAAAAFFVSASLLAVATPAGAALPPPPDDVRYHGVYPGEEASGGNGWEDKIALPDVVDYEAAAGRHVAWVYFSNNWFSASKRDFPTATAEWIRAHDSVPFIRLMLRSKQDPVRDAGPYPLKKIARGNWDQDLEEWGDTAADFGDPVIVDFGVEMNGKWFPWNGKWNGGPGKGPDRFVKAYRHIHDVIESRGPDVTWVFHVNDGDTPNVPWNKFERYYPGDDYVDWVGFSAYGALTPCYQPDEWAPFAGAADATIDRLAALAPEKPIFVFEFGTSAIGKPNPAGEDQAAWAEHALETVLADDRIAGFSWWNEKWRNGGCADTNMQVQNDPALGNVFQVQLDTAALIDGWPPA